VRKIFWLDVETTGTDSEKCAIVQLAGLIEIDKKIIDTFSFEIKPHDGALIIDEALKVSGRTREQLETYLNHKDVYKLLCAGLGKIVNKYVRSDKLILAGYNVHFDDSFLRALFERCNDKYYGSFIAWPKLDVATFVADRLANGAILPDYKLSTFCAKYEVNLVAHDALSDILATRDLYYKLGGTYVA
jgi:DNA polymerase III subunit epsilon